jgi:hypothetical protein
MTIVTPNTSDLASQPPISDAEARGLAGAIAQAGATKPPDEAEIC